MKKILLFGANGQLGREWQHYLSDNFNKPYLLEAYTSAQLNISRFDEVKHELAAQQADIIINCAAYTKVDEAEDHFEEARLVNGKAVDNLAEWCAAEDALLVHFSTDYIFAGRREDEEKFPDGYPVNHPANPVNAYGQSKWEGEQGIRKSGCRHLIVRTSWLCGEYGNNFVKTMLRLAASRKELSIVDDQTGSPSFAGDLVKNTFKLIDKNRNGTYHFTSQGCISWADFAKVIFEIAGLDVQVKRISSAEYRTKAKRPFFSKLDTRKINKTEGIEIKDWKKNLKHLMKRIK